MTKTSNALAVAVAVSAVAALLFLFGSFQHASVADAAGGAPGDFGTTTDATFIGVRTLKEGHAPVLGSIIVGSSSAATAIAQITVYDATSTMATTTAKVLARIGANNATPATYMYDESANYGLKVEVAAGYNGSATITWR